MTDDEPALGPIPSVWYAAFYGDEDRWWWDRICKPGFRHVAAYTYYPGPGVWVLYDVTFNRTCIRVFSREEWMAWMRTLPCHTKHLRCGIPDEPHARPWWLKLTFWCAPAVAHLMGIRSRALRPEALYRDLVRHGALPAFED